MSIKVTLTEKEILDTPNEETKEDEFDKCVICGKESPYLKSTHIDLRTGYVEGGGQGCFQPNGCDKV
jgi:hypothetical protein